MKHKLLFIILCVETLTFAGCGKTETPVMSNSVETESSTEVETTIENEEITEEVEAPTETIIEETVENNQETTTSTVDSTGSDVQIDEGDYVEPSVEDNAEAADKVANNGMAMSRDEALADAQRWLDEGLIDESEYQELLELIEDTYAPKPSQPSQQPSYGQIQLTPEQQAAADAMYNNGKGVGDPRTDIQYGQGDYTGLEHIRIN